MCAKSAADKIDTENCKSHSSLHLCVSYWILTKLVKGYGPRPHKGPRSNPKWVIIHIPNQRGTTCRADYSVFDIYTTNYQIYHHSTCNKQRIHTVRFRTFSTFELPLYVGWLSIHRNSFSHTAPPTDRCWHFSPL